MGVKTEVVVTINCQNCSCTDTEVTNTERWGEKSHREKSFNLDHEYRIIDSYKIAYNYKCKGCGHSGREYDNHVYG